MGGWVGAHSLPKTFSKIPRRKVVCNHIRNCTRWESEWARGRGDCESDRGMEHRAQGCTRGCARGSTQGCKGAARIVREIELTTYYSLLTTYYYWLLLLATYYLHTKKPVGEVRC